MMLSKAFIFSTLLTVSQGATCTGNDPKGNALNGCVVDDCSFIGDGFCDMKADENYNTDACNFDGGDCCEDTCESTKTHLCGARGPRSYNCEAAAATTLCSDVYETLEAESFRDQTGDRQLSLPKQLNKGVSGNAHGGGVEITDTDGTLLGYVRHQNLPCHIGRVTVSVCGTSGEPCDFPYKAQYDEAFLNIALTPQRLEQGKTGHQFRWIPRYSCAAYGCTNYYWQGSTFSCLQNAQPCNCDDACTKYKDCCYDYAWTCGASYELYSSSAYNSGAKDPWDNTWESPELDDLALKMTMGKPRAHFKKMLRWAVQNGQCVRPYSGGL